MKPRQASKVSRRPSDERGAVLLVVSLILSLISVMILSWAREWRTELALTSNFVETRKSRRLAEAGIFYALGKVVEAHQLEINARQPGALQQSSAAAQNTWRLDQQPHLLEFPEGQVEIRIADEGGKFNLNLVSEDILFRLFSILSIPELNTRTMVDSILDWRSKGDQPRPYGAKSSYYLGLDPPYVAKNGRFETVEELAWVKGFENSPILPRLADFLTVQPSGRGINLNTAPPQVLRAAGFSAAAVEAIITARQEEPLRDLTSLDKLLAEPQVRQRMLLSFTSSIFFTIKSKGMVKNGKGLYTIRAIVRLQPNQPYPWEIISWVDDFPG